MHWIKISTGYINLERILDFDQKSGKLYADVSENHLRELKGEDKRIVEEHLEILARASESHINMIKEGRIVF